MGKLHKSHAFRAETLFLLGLFSKLDMLLAQPMDKLQNIPLDKQVEDALLSKPSPYWALVVAGGRYRDWQLGGRV